jgi:CHAT domain-containing protein
MLGIGKEIAEKLPDSVWPALREVWDAVRASDSAGIPNVLLLTDDPYVPWELAWLDETLDESVPSFLGAQVNIGRWSADEDHIPAGTALDVQGLGVVVGYYEDARGVAPLPSAAEEGEALADKYVAQAVEATDRSLDQVLRGKLEGDEPFEFEAIHFAGHGESDPDKNAAYIMLSNGTRLSDFVFRAPTIAAEKQAFLFLNACQVGTAFGMLGEYAGVAGRAIRAGFRGFVAPLWSVADDVAKDISLGFYESSAKGKTVAEFFRTTRTRFLETETEDAHTTYLAYLFYGHPATKLGGPQRRGSS